MTDDTSQAWHLDKRVPIAIIVSLLIQSAAIIWWARGLEAAVTSQDSRLAALEKARDNDHVSERLAVLEVRVTQVLALAETIDRRMRDRDSDDRTARANKR